MNKRQVKPGDWVKVSDKETHKTYKGKYGWRYEEFFDTIQGALAQLVRVSLTRPILEI